MSGATGTSSETNRSHFVNPKVLDVEKDDKSNPRNAAIVAASRALEVKQSGQSHSTGLRRDGASAGDDPFAGRPILNKLTLTPEEQAKGFKQYCPISKVTLSSWIAPFAIGLGIYAVRKEIAPLLVAKVGSLAFVKLLLVSAVVLFVVANCFYHLFKHLGRINQYNHLPQLFCEDKSKAQEQKAFFRFVAESKADEALAVVVLKAIDLQVDKIQKAKTGQEQSDLADSFKHNLSALANDIEDSTIKNYILEASKKLTSRVLALSTSKPKAD